MILVAVEMENLDNNVRYSTEHPSNICPSICSYEDCLPDTVDRKLLYSYRDLE